MGPLNNKIRLGYSPILFTFNSLLLIITLLFRICHRHKMSAAATPTLQEDQVPALAEEAAAAVRAAIEDARRRPAGSTAHPTPASGGFVHMDTALPPATERSKIIRINRQLNSAAEILGDAGGETALSCLENFHSIRDGRTHRSVLVENMSDPGLPKKHNFEQWGGGEGRHHSIRPGHACVAAY
jgi:hypothetical protein